MRDHECQAVVGRQAGTRQLQSRCMKVLKLYRIRSYVLRNSKYGVLNPIFGLYGNSRGMCIAAFSYAAVLGHLEIASSYPAARVRSSHCSNRSPLICFRWACLCLAVKFLEPCRGSERTYGCCQRGRLEPSGNETDIRFM